MSRWTAYQPEYTPTPDDVAEVSSTPEYVFLGLVMVAAILVPLLIMLIIGRKQRRELRKRRGRKK